MQRPVGAPRELRIVRDDHQRRADHAIEIEHQVEHVRGGTPVEVAGRLVGEHAARLRHQRARERHPLALAARELAGQVAQPVREADVWPASRARCRVASGEREPPPTSGIATFSTAVNSGSRWWNW